MKPPQVRTVFSGEDENDSVSTGKKQQLSPCIEKSMPVASTSSVPWSPSTPMEFRSPSPASARNDKCAARKNPLPSGLRIPKIESSAESQPSFSSLICSLSSHDLPESDAGQEAVTVWPSTRRKEPPEAPLSPGEALGFSEEMSKAFSDGTLLPYFMSLLHPPSIQDEQRTTWNGHLPLDPVPSPEEPPHVQWATPRASRKRLHRQPSPPAEDHRPLSPHTIFPTTLTDPDQVEILFHSASDVVCSPFLPFFETSLLDRPEIVSFTHTVPRFSLNRPERRVVQSGR